MLFVKNRTKFPSLPRSQSFISDLVLRGKETHHSTPKAATKYTDTSYNRLRGKQENTSGTFQEKHIPEHTGEHFPKHSRKNNPEHTGEYFPEHSRKNISGKTIRNIPRKHFPKYPGDNFRNTREITSTSRIPEEDFRNIPGKTLQEKHSGTSQENTFRNIRETTSTSRIPEEDFRNIQKITSGIPGRLSSGR